MAILQAIREDQQFGFGNKLVRLFLNHAEARFCVPWPSTQNEVKEYFGDNISHVFVELFSDQTTPPRVFINVTRSSTRVWPTETMEIRIGEPIAALPLVSECNLRPSDFAGGSRTRELWLKDDTSEADKDYALSRTELHRQIQGKDIRWGFKEIMDDLMAEWRG